MEYLNKWNVIMNKWINGIIIINNNNGIINNIIKWHMVGLLNII